MPRLTEISPLTGEMVATYESMRPEEVADAVQRAREVFAASWGQTSVDERLIFLRRMRALLIDEMDAVVDVIRRTTGKIRLEALAADVMTSVDTIDYLIEHAQDVLASEPRPAPRFFRDRTFWVEYSPIGTIAILSPWNYPLQLALVPLVTALAAGNCVVLKPSEITPSVGTLIEQMCARIELPPGVVQVLPGDRTTGEALVASRPDAIFFTGSVATGKKVLTAAAENLIPVILELGGKDPMIVFQDALFDRAVAAAVYGAFTNAGQTCVSVERLYVERPIYERFLEALTAATQKLRVDPDGEGDLGPIINPAQIAVIEAHLDDALAQGAVSVTAPRRERNFYHPVILRDVNHSMRIMKEETFGPVLPVMPFSSEDEAVALANDTPYGLNASIWTQDLIRGRRVARRLITGSCAINDVLINIANPYLPFGGEKHSGIGRYHGPEGLRAFSRQKSIMVSQKRTAREIHWFPYTHSRFKGLKAMIHALYDPKPPWTRARNVLADLVGWGRKSSH